MNFEKSQLQKIGLTRAPADKDYIDMYTVLKEFISLIGKTLPRQPFSKAAITEQKVRRPQK